MGHFPASFFFIFVFSKQLIVNGNEQGGPWGIKKWLIV